MDTGTEGLARAWAFEAHKDQSYGPHSYRYHLEKVVEKISEFSTDADVISAGWLHDCPEDTVITVTDIHAKISFDCGEIVDLVTDPDGYDNRKDRKIALYAKFNAYAGDAANTHSVEQIKQFAGLVKGADRFCNHQESYQTHNKGTMRMYLKEFPEFIKVYGPYMPDFLYLELFSQYALMIQYFSEVRG